MARLASAKRLQNLSFPFIPVHPLARIYLAAKRPDFVCRKSPGLN
jgi:hypothetical protein